MKQLIRVVLPNFLFAGLVCCLFSAPIAAQSHYFKKNEKKPRVIVFVHGVIGMPVETWTARNGAYWPSLLKQDADFGLSDLYVSQYKTFRSPKSFTTQSIDEDAAELWTELAGENVWSDHREVVFLCHSLGGLAVERMLVLHPEVGRKVPFIVSYGTPHEGSYIANIASLFGFGGNLVKTLSETDDNTYLKNLDSDWRGTADVNTIRRFCAFEGEDTPLPDQLGLRHLGSVRVVPYFSATYDCDTSTPVMEILANHYEIVKPMNAKSTSYVFFKQVYQDNPVIEIRVDERVETSSELTVDCERTNSDQDLKISTTLDPKLQERVTGAKAELVNTSNIKDENNDPTRIIKLENGTAHVRYGFNGRDRQGGDCPGGGHAWVKVTFDVEQRIPLRDADVSGASTPEK